jgi:hypothetical protein
MVRIIRDAELYNCATSYNDITVTIWQASRHLVYC